MQDNDSLSNFHLFSKILEGNYGPLVQTLGIAAFVLLFNFVIKALIFKLSRHFEKQQKVWALSFVSALDQPLTYLVWFVAILCAVDTLTSSLFNLHLSYIHLILHVGAILTFGWFLLRWNKGVIQNMQQMSQDSKILMTAGNLDLISKLVKIAIVFVTIFLLMDATGRNMQTLIAFGGIGGLALAFASQQVISNFFGGLMIYITQPFTVGEWISLPERNIEGIIEEIGWYLTRIRNFDKRPIYVPNSIFTQTVVMTPSRMSHQRLNFVIGVRYRDIQSIKLITEKIKLMLLKHSAVDRQFNVEAFFKNFAPSALEIEISAYVTTTPIAQFRMLKQEILLNIADIVAQTGAEIATPTNIVEIQGVMMKNPEQAPVIPPSLKDNFFKLGETRG